MRGNCRRFCAAVLLLLLIGIGPVLAAAPAGLRNKTIHVSYVPTTPAIRDGKQVAASRAISRTIYVSSVGRAFVQRSDRAAKLNKVGEGGPEATSRAYRFEGSRLFITVRAGGNAARQIVVNFDSNFQSCTVDVKTGVAGGSARTWIGLNGHRYTATGPTSISNPTCSISNGNAFAR